MTETTTRQTARALSLAPNAESLSSKHFPADAPVLKGRKLRQGDEGALPVFGDDLWDLRRAVHRENIRDSVLILNFRLIDDLHWRLLAKEYLYACMTKRIPAGGRGTLALTSAESELKRLRMFIVYLQRVRPDMRLRDATQDLMNGYHTACLIGADGTSVSRSWVEMRLRIPIKLFHYGSWLSHDRLSFLPWAGRTASDVAGKGASGENSTPRIPESVMGPYFRWALRYIEEFADEIIAARTQAIVPSASVGGPRGSSAVTTTAERLRAWVDGRRADGRGVPRFWPGHQGYSRMIKKGEKEIVNRLQVATEAGIDVSNFYKTKALGLMLAAAIDELGWANGPGSTGEHPTLGSLRGGWDRRKTLEELYHLTTACYVVVAYLSGMRDSEVQSLKVGCHRAEPAPDGLGTRHTLHGTAYKGQTSTGAESAWVVIEQVGQAIHVLESLAHLENRGEVGAPLFLRPVDGEGSRHIKDNIGLYLNRFRAHVNRLADGNDSLPRIPTHEGEVWRFQTRQFRRTIAWHIANRPFGTIALKIQFKHVWVQMSEGYAGQSASGFSDEVMAERLLTQEEVFLEQYEDVRTGRALTGPAAPRLRAEFEQIMEALGDFPGRPRVDPDRLRVMIRNMAQGGIARTLHPGLLNHCYYEPGRALCQQKAPGGDRSLPIFGQCEPMNCPNSCITERHLPMWEDAASNARDLLKDKRAPRNARAKIQQGIARLENVVAALRGEATKPPRGVSS